MEIRLNTLYSLILLPALLLAQVYPGLFEADGTPHPVHDPNPVTGQTINVLDFGADPADNDIDDRPAIEAALQAAGFGDELYFPAGIYNFNSARPGDARSHIILKNGVNWRGEGMAQSILKSGFGDQTIDRFLKMRAVHDVVIAGFTITSDFTGKYSTDTSNNNPQAGGPKYVISIEDENGIPSYNITVDSVLVENYRTHGVRLSNSHDVVVKNCIFQKATDVGGGGAGYGVSIQGNGENNNNSKFNVVENCRALGPYMRHGFLMQYATHNNEVRNNYCEDTRLDAIDLHGEDEYLNEIYENEVRNVLKGAGVGVGNTGSTHDRSGPHNYIHHNLFVDCREGVKVYLGSPDTRIENNEITGSTVSSGRGIYILNGPRTIIRGNHIHDNTGPSFAGILLQYDGGTEGKGKGAPKDVRIIENSIYNNPYGVRLFYGERIIYEDNDVHDNSIADFYASANVTFNKWLAVAITGEGWVETSPPGDSFAEGESVIVTARPRANWKFDRWEGDINSSDNPLTLVMDESKKITAVFIEDGGADQVNLFTNIVGSGQILLDPPGGVYQRGQLVKVTAIADSAWAFRGWSGDLSGSSAVDSLVMDSDKTIVATFERAQIFAIVPWIIGKGQLVYDPPGGSYVEGTQVIITAVPDEGWIFKSWGGSLSGSENPDTLIMDSQKAIMVTFEQASYVMDAVVYAYELKQNYPNPFNGSTTIEFSLEKTGWVTLEILDVHGRQVDVIVDRELPMGMHSYNWRADGVASGLYFVRLRARGFEAIKRMALIK